MDKVWQWGVVTLVAVFATAGAVFFVNQNSFDLKMSVLQRQISDLKKELVTQKSMPVVEENKVAPVSEVKEKCFSKYEITRIIDSKDRSLSFEYPCGWNLRNPGANSIIVSSPDGKAKFQWPLSDIGLHDMKLQEEGKVLVNGVEYPFSKYQAENSWLEVVEVVYDKNDADFRGFMLSGEGSIYDEELAQILASVKF